MAQLSGASNLDDVVRRERRRVVGALVRLLGNLDAAEEAFQEAVLAALPSWRAQGTPDNPGAWLTTAAKNYARDAARHQRVVQEKAPLLAESEASSPDELDTIHDDELRLLFGACHPSLTPESQIALTLKVVAGLTTHEIARAFLAPEPAIAQRIVRAKRTLEEERVSFVVPERAQLPERLSAVLTVIYLVFNEGHTAREGAWMRVDLQAEAFRLARLLCDLMPREAEVFGLYALIAFAIARVATRTDDRGELVVLAEQDRARWDRAAIKEGLMALSRARRLGGRESYVLQAELAACHAIAPTWEATDWRRILELYDAIMAHAPSPVVALNRAVAVSMIEGPAAGLLALVALEEPLASYHHFYATRAELRQRLGEDARGDYERALELATNESEQRFLRRKIDSLR